MAQPLLSVVSRATSPAKVMSSTSPDSKNVCGGSAKVRHGQQTASVATAVVAAKPRMVRDGRVMARMM